MAVKVLIPTPLRNLTDNQAEVSAEGATVKDLIEDLGKNHKGLKDRLCDENGKIRRFVNIYLNEEDIRFLQGDATVVKAGDQVSIVPAIAGGLS
jgi:molybdopterin synthase sulfur carrier subunit